MDKLLDAVLDTSKDLAKGRLTFLRIWLDAVSFRRDLVVTVISQLLRRSGDKTILVVAILASCWAAYGYVSSLGKDPAPKPTHDAILKARFSGPPADAKVVILDVDERSIAALSDTHGRWPWSRDVLAEGMQRLEASGARAVLFNVLLAEPDKQNPEADAAMAVTAQLFRPAAFPLIRLAKENDSLSEVRVSMIPGADIQVAGQDKTVSLVIPIFASMHDRLGIANQLPDTDGIVRRYPFWWAEEGYRIPSIVQTTLSSALISFTPPPERYSLNWRNKKGGYERISFSDLYRNTLSEAEQNSLNQAVVVISVSAPGIGQTKPTGIKPIVDDGEILATALDDAINNTYLRVTAPWVLLLLNLASIWLLYLAFANRAAKSPPINRIFVILQFALGGVTLLSASYTNYIVDLTDSMKFSLAVFGAIKLLQGFDARWYKGKKGYRRFRKLEENGVAMIYSFLENPSDVSAITVLHRGLERTLGVNRVVYVDDLLGGDNFLKSALSSSRSFVVFVKSEAEREQVEHLTNTTGLSGFVMREVPLPGAWNLEDKELAQRLAPEILGALSQLHSNAN